MAFLHFRLPLGVNFGTGDEFDIGRGGDCGEVGHGHSAAAEAGVPQGVAGRVGSPGGAGYVGHGDAGRGELLEEGTAGGWLGVRHGHYS